MASNTTVTSMLANAKYAGVSVPPQVDQILEAVANTGPWTVFFTLLAVLVAYDQSKTALICAKPGAFGQPTTGANGTCL